MSTLKIERETKAMLRRHQLTLVEWHNGRGHAKIRVRAQDGREATFVVSRSPSDRRAALNEEARYRRFAGGAR
jgi:hypothetical protein